MKQRIFRAPVALFVVLVLALSGLLAGSDVRADDRVELAGNIVMATLPVAALGLNIGFQDGQGAVELTESTALSMGVMLALKFGINATRPNGGSQSFPSGHSTFAFTSAEFMRKRYGWDYGLPAYAAATFVAYSRVEAGQHYAIDVLGGAVLGIASSYLATRSYKGWKIQPEAGSSYLGIRLERNW